MPLTPYRQQRIYLAATMGYGLGSDDPEEIAYYQKIQADQAKDRNNRNMGTARDDQWID